MSILTPTLKTSPVIHKLEKPVLTKEQIPYPAECIYNAGVAKYNGKYVMVFRDDYGANESVMDRDPEEFFKNLKTSIGVAFSDNGIDWEVRKTPLFDSTKFSDEEFKRFYDPRLTIIEGKPYLCMAMDTAHGIRGCIASVDDNFEKIEILSATAPDNRNMVLFPERINGHYVRLERPFPVYGRCGEDRFDIWMSKSPDLRFWGDTSLLLGVEHVPYANDKIGPAAPPIKTEKGWLATFHAVDIDPDRGKNGWEPAWKKRYTAGIMLLDLEEPAKVVGMSKLPLIAPELPFEVEEGMRQNVIFPGGMILEPSGEVKIYYGASDTVECLATADVNDLIALCIDKK